MTSADSYRKIAVHLRTKAANEKVPDLARQFEDLAKCYLRLAEQADKNRLQDLWFEIGPPPRLNSENA